MRWEWPRGDRVPINGRAEVVDYWKDWVKRATRQKLKLEFEVKFCTFYSRTALCVYPKDYATCYVLFYIENNKVQLGVYVERFIAKMNVSDLAYKQEVETLDNFPLALKNIKKMSELEARDDRMPCLNCGMASRKLSWERAVFSMPFDFKGLVSRCPYCGKVVELVFEEKSVFCYANRKELDTENNQSNEPWFSSIFSFPCYYNWPLQNSKFIASLPKKKTLAIAHDIGTSNKIKWEWMRASLYEVASDFMEGDIDGHFIWKVYHENRKDYEKIKKCYIDALNNGVYEAANNLGLLAYCIEHVKEEALDYFRIAVKHKSETAQWNLINILWKEGKYEDVISMFRGGDDNDKNDFEEEWNVFQKISKLRIIQSDLDYSQLVNVFFPEIKIEKDWYISIWICSDGSYVKGDNSRFYAADSKNSKINLNLDSYSNIIEEKRDFEIWNLEPEPEIFEGERDFDVWKHVIMSKSKRAIWDLYLLMNANTVLPYRGHGAYSQRVFIFDNSEFAKISILRDRDVSAVIEKGYTRPVIEIEEFDGGFDAHVYCCYWNEWKGLIREHIFMKIQGDRVVEYRKMEDFVIFSYHCEIFY